MPNSLSDLNQYSNTQVFYNDDRDYSITFSANAASNTSTIINEDQSFVLPTGIDITSVISQPGNITYNVNATGVGSVLGTWPTLPYGVSNTSSGNIFSITGVFSPETWQQAKNLTLLFPDKDTDFSFTANIQYPNPANVSQTLTKSWTNNVDIDQTNADLTLTPTYYYTEDQSTPLVFSILDNDPTATSYTMSFDQFGGNSGIITVNGVSAGLGNVATITGSKATVNAANVVFWPYPDTTSVVSIGVTASKINGVGNIVFASNVLMSLFGSAGNSSYTLTDTYSYAEDATTNMVFNIPESDATNPTYTVSFAQSSGNTGMFYVNNVAQGIGNVATITGNVATINAANVSFLPAVDTTSTVGLTYSQSKTSTLFGNIVQATAVPITLTNTTTHNEYSLTTNYNYIEDVGNVIAFQITDTDTRASSYTVNLTQTSGNVGMFFVNGVAQGLGNAVTLTNTRANINSANVTFLPYVDTTSTVGLTYSQSKVNSVYGNVTQASNVPVTLTCVGFQNNYNWVGGTYNEDTVLYFGNTIGDTDANATSYTVTVSQTSGNVGTWVVNNAETASSSLPLVITDSKGNINNKLGWKPPIDYTGNVVFQYSQTKVNSVYGNVTQASNVAATWTVSGTNPEIVNMIDRTYTSNTVNYIFSTSTPYISDGPDYGQTYTVTLTSTQGKFGNSFANASGLSGNTWTYTGNITQVNDQFTKIVFLPTKYVPASTGTFRYTQKRGTTEQANIVCNLTGTTQDYNSVYAYTNLSSSSWTPSDLDRYYGQNFTVTAIGGGGGGGKSAATPLHGAGGSGGSVVQKTFAITPGDPLISFYGFLIGYGGAGATGSSGNVIVTKGSPGQDSYFARGTSKEVYADGGEGGNTSVGGDTYSLINGTTINYTGGASAANLVVGYGGGGAGAGANGENAVIGSSGTGGTGYTINLGSAGNAIVAYGGGGSGTDKLGSSPTAAGSGGRGGNATQSGSRGRDGGIYIRVT